MISYSIFALSPRIWRSRSLALIDPPMFDESMFRAGRKDGARRSVVRSQHCRGDALENDKQEEDVPDYGSHASRSEKASSI